MTGWGELRRSETFHLLRQSPPQYDAPVFLVDLIYLVLFLIAPVRCNGGFIDLKLKPTLIGSALMFPPGAADSGDRSDWMAQLAFSSPHQSQPHRVGRRLFDV